MFYFYHTFMFNIIIIPIITCSYWFLIIFFFMLKRFLVFLIILPSISLFSFFNLKKILISLTAVWSVSVKRFLTSLIEYHLFLFLVWRDFLFLIIVSSISFLVEKHFLTSLIILFSIFYLLKDFHHYSLWKKLMLFWKKIYSLIRVWKFWWF